MIWKLVILVILDPEKGVSRAFVQCKSSIVSISSRTLLYFKAPLKKESVAQTDLLYTTTSYLPFSTPRCRSLLLAPRPAPLTDSKALLCGIHAVNDQSKSYVYPGYMAIFMVHKNNFLSNPIYMAGAKASHISQRELLEEFDPVYMHRRKKCTS